MPKGKRKFIDRKNAVTFHVVHRSQQDPLINDEDAPQRVLLPSTGKGGEEQRKVDKEKWGITWEDDYDYLQHMRSTSEGCEGELVRYRIMASHPSSTDGKLVKLKLPSSVFASSVEENVGVLNLAAPRPGPQLDLDPDIVAAMDEDFDYSDTENVLDDDFILQANAGDEGCDNSGSSAEDDVSSGGIVSSDDATDEDDVDDVTDEDEDDVVSLKDSEFTFAEEETKSRFTNYSVSSSVIRRNEHLALLDDRFEKLFEGYDDGEIGALDCEEIEGYLASDADAVLQCVKEFDRQQAVQKLQIDTAGTTVGLAASSEEDEDMTDVEVQDRDDRLDCESILSTYSNLFNHPKLITEPAVSKRIRVSVRTGLPVGVLGGGPKGKLTAKALANLDAATLGTSAGDKAEAESIVSALTVLSIRPKGETPEARRERKKVIKDYRKDRRMEKKANTLAFKEEKKKQEKNMLNAKATFQTVRVL